MKIGFNILTFKSNMGNLFREAGSMKQGPS